MTISDKVEMVNKMTGADEDTIFVYLKIAAQKICRAAYPFDDTVDEVPPKYDMIHVDATAYLINKRGAEGEITHNENGISRTYEDADLPKSMLRAITPVMGVPK